VLRDGVITAVGTHRELLASDPEYRALLSSAEDMAEEEVRT
jgi:ABC-type transport system involved in Fe-S cluster assembly fused permease/ATPase subunit